MSGIQVISKQSHDIMLASEQNSANIKMDIPSVVVIQEKLQNVAEIKKDGNDLLIIMNDGQAIVLQDYFVQGMTQHELVFDEGNQQLIWTQFTDLKNFVDGVTYDNIDSINALLDFNIAIPEATPFLYGLGVASLVAGGIVMLTNDSSNNNTSNNVVATRNSATQNVTLVEQAQSAAMPTAASESNQATDTATDTASANAGTESTEPQSASVEAPIESATASDTSQASPEANSDVMFNLLSNAESQSTQSGTPTETAAQPSADFDWNALFSDSSTPAEIELPAQETASAENATNSTSAQSQQAEPQVAEQFSLPSFNLFDLLNTQWLA